MLTTTTTACSNAPSLELDTLTSSALFQNAHLTTRPEPTYNKPTTVKHAVAEDLPSTVSSPGQSSFSHYFPESPSPVEGNGGAVEVIRSVNNPKINRYRLASACLIVFNLGLHDAAVGALIPSMETHYGIGYKVVSFVFLAVAAGYILTAPIAHSIYSHLGRARTVLAGTATQSIGWLIIAMAPPFAVVVFGFFLIGVGSTFILAQCNVFCSSLANSTVLLGYFHGSYGIGGICAPLIATAMVTHGIPWSRFFWLLFSLSIFNSFTSTYVFWNTEKEAHIPAPAAAAAPLSRRKVLKKSLMDATTIAAAIFIFAYQGTEVANSGWTVSFLITVRKGDPTQAGLIASGFWIGQTMGRFVLSHLCRRFGEIRSTFVLIAGSILFETLIWVIPNIISNAIHTAIVGLLLGPIYPCVMTVVTRIIPPQFIVSSLSVISALGSSGGAIAPFTTGVLSEKYGAWVLYPVCISLLGAMLPIWVFVSRSSSKRSEE